MILADAAVLPVHADATVPLIGTNAALQRPARPDRGVERTAGCRGMAPPAEITELIGAET